MLYDDDVAFGVVCCFVLLRCVVLKLVLFCFVVLWFGLFVLLCFFCISCCVLFCMFVCLFVCLFV